jgi:predicted transposase/invertase (TIGR01784 family)
MAKSKKEVFQPDDRFFRFVMSQEKNARAYLQSFYPEIAAIADLDSLQVEPDDFLRPNLRLFRSDVVYRCSFKDSLEQFYFTLIWEHKSKPEEEVAIQVGLYIFSALHRMSKTEHRKLEPILPLLFYNGKEDWEPKTVYQLFSDLPNYDIFKKYLPNFNFLFLNVSGMDPEELLLLETSFFRSAMLAMAIRFRQDLIIPYILLIFGHGNNDEIQSIVTYIAAVCERSPIEIQEIINKQEFTTKPLVMSTLQMLKDEGRVEGRVEGKIEGKTLQSLKSFLSVLIIAPNWGKEQLSKVSGIPSEIIGSFLAAMKTSNENDLMRYLENAFPEMVNFSVEELLEIRNLIAQLRAQE